jgi:hypothetical protein
VIDSGINNRKPHITLIRDLSMEVEGSVDTFLHAGEG